MSQTTTKNDLQTIDLHTLVKNRAPSHTNPSKPANPRHKATVKHMHYSKRQEKGTGDIRKVMLSTSREYVSLMSGGPALPKCDMAAASLRVSRRGAQTAAKTAAPGPSAKGA